MTKERAIFISCIVALFLLVVAFAMTIWGWMLERTAPETTPSGLGNTIPLLTFGCLLVFIIVVRVENAIAVTLSIIIIGTVVAGDRFILAVTAIVQGQEEGYGFAERIYNQSRRTAVADTADAGMSSVQAQQFAEAVAAAIKEGGAESGVNKITALLSRTEVERILDRVNAESNPNLLEDISGDRQSWRDTVRSLEIIEAFRSDMRVLLNMGLVDYSGSNFSDATLTDLGTRVLDLSNERRFSTAPATMTGDVDLLSREDRPNDLGEGDKRRILFGVEKVRFEFEQFSSVWLHFEVSSDQTVVVETSTQNIANRLFDTFVSLYVLGEFDDRLASDDDSGEGLDSLIEIQLAAGRYALEVANLADGPGAFDIKVGPKPSAAE